MIRKAALLMLILIQVGCSAPTPEPTVTPTVTATQTPASTSTPIPAPTATATPSPKAIDVEADGFNFSVPLNMDYDLKNNIVGVYDLEGTFIASFIRATYDETTHSLEETLNAYLNEVTDRGGDFTQGEPYPVTVGGADGLAVDLTGKLISSPVEGRAFIVEPEDNVVFFGLGVSNLTANDEQWKASGEGYFQSLIDSVQFVEVQNSKACIISDDKTYGYSETNPIKVGGDWLEGPAREEAYLDNLLGPNGEILTYERLGSASSGDTILDEYHITGSGVDATLYLDEYNYSPLQAPVGFTCIGEFPLSAP